jgi:hypothetical protein
VRTPHNNVRSPVRPATRWMRVVSRASARVIAGRRAGSRRAHIDLSAPDELRNERLCPECPHECSLLASRQAAAVFSGPFYPHGLRENGGSKIPRHVHRNFGRTMARDEPGLAGVIASFGRRGRGAGLGTIRPLRSDCRRQGAQAHHVVHGCRNGQPPPHPSDPTMSRLPRYQRLRSYPWQPSPCIHLRGHPEVELWALVWTSWPH